jgi:uncharacterized Zn-binding protein involved in type VI secretion
MSFVNVTMMAGKDPTVKLQEGVGQGKRLLCQIPASMVAMAPYGARVLVALPEPCPDVPGHAVVLTTLGNTAWKTQGNTGAGDVVINCPSGPARIILTAKGAGIFVTEADDGSTIMASIDPTNGCHLMGPWGQIDFDNYGLRGNIGGGPGFKFYNVGGLPAPFDILAGSVAQITGSTVKVDGVNVLLGPDSVTTDFVPTAAYGDTTSPPAPSPLLAALIEALPAYIQTVNAALSGGNTGGPIAGAPAVAAAGAILTQAIIQASTILTTTCVKVASPV